MLSCDELGALYLLKDSGKLVTEVKLSYRVRLNTKEANAFLSSIVQCSLHSKVKMQRKKYI
jgi:hypothetical protein